MVKKQIDIFVRFITDTKKALAMPMHQMKQLEEVSKKTGAKLDRFRKTTKKNWSAGKRFGMELRRLTHGFRGFRMEMLGVMFFGMGVMNFFTGLLAPAMKMAGIFDLMNTILGVVFLPIVLALLDPLLQFGMWLMGLSDSSKMLIGWIVIIGAVLGGALFFVGMFALGIGSLILAFGGLIGFIGKLIPGPIGQMIAGFIGINAAMAGGSVLIPIWDSLKTIVSGLWKKLLEMPAVQKLLDKFGLTVEDLETPFVTIKKKFKEMFDEFMKGHPELQKEVDKLKEKWDEATEIFDKFKKMWDKISKAFEDVDWSNLAKQITNITLNILPPFITIAEKLLGVLDSIGESDVWQFVNENFPKGMNVISKVSEKRSMAENIIAPATGSVGILVSVLSDLLEVNKEMRDNAPTPPWNLITVEGRPVYLPPTDINNLNPTASN